MSNNTRNIPLSALSIAADVELGEAVDGASSVPIRIIARTSRAVFKSDWDPELGPIVHDMSGLSQTKATIPLDYCHDQREVLGYATNLDVSSGALTADGMLTPFRADDRSAEVIAKGRTGVPYGASIYFDEQTCVAEEVASGVTVTVNGEDLTGPAIVIRHWDVRGIAVCLYGVDSESQVQFSKQSRNVAVQLVKGKTQMSTQSSDPPKPAEEPTKCSFDEFCATLGIKDVSSLTDDGRAMLEAKYAETQEVEPKPPAEEPPADPPKPKPSEDSQLSIGRQFMTEFGEQGAVWFVEGLTLDQARTKFASSLKDRTKALESENADLKAKLADAQTKLSLKRGETTPVSFSETNPPPALDSEDRKSRIRSTFEQKLAACKKN